MRTHRQMLFNPVGKPVALELLGAQPRNDVYGQAGLFVDFSNDGRLRRFAVLDLSAGKGPGALRGCTGATNELDATLRVDLDGTDRRHEPRCVLWATLHA
ncbi:MAG TPA: hypothetical protein VMT47_19345 [Polyangia bacterium]|nr:hypothetical protein [Polyangia bacterium]